MEVLTGKTALVTGGGRGIGRSVAVALAQEGVNVGLIGRTEEVLQMVAEEVRSLGVQAATAVADVSDIHSVNEAVAKIQKELGQIDILVNNAGILKFAKFLELEPAEWENIIKVNLFGMYYVTRAVLPSMMERQTGDIINISSSAGLRGSAQTSSYSASKFAVLGLTESLMQEVRKFNVRVTALTPSTVLTDMARNGNLINNNEERMIHPEDFAELIIAQLKLNRRVFVKDASIWSTNP
ncbi:MAG TPA: 3-ketoacyl-ACP reductase [Chitinophagaceae bacterium]|jgi:3-oxoacyl-[acyl-carrier protein] reductase|nr:3-ketoacyl-ACP reductase [Chitinophagaceae bacterium]